VTAHISDIAKKYRRALRNETGTKFTLAELRAMVDIGWLELAAKAEAEEIRKTWEKIPHLASSETIGSTSAGTADLPTSGRLPDMTAEQGRMFIAALGAKH